MKEWKEADIEQETQDDSSGFLGLLNKLLSNWYWFLLSGIVGLAIAFVYLRYTTPVYKIKARVLVSDQQKGTGVAAQGAFMGDFENLIGGVSSVENEAEILKTRYLMEQVVRKLNAQVTIYHPGEMRDVEVHRAPFSITLLNTDTLRGGTYVLEPLDTAKVRISKEGFETEVSYGIAAALPGIGPVRITRNEAVPYGENKFKFNISQLDRKVNEYMGRLSVSVGSKLVSVIDLTFNYPLQQKGEEILNTVIDTYVQNNLRDKNTVADSTIAFIDNRLLYVGQELSSVEGNIQTFRQQQQLADIDAQSQLLLQNSSEYIKELAAVETQLSILNNVESYLSEENNERVLPSAVLPEDVVFTRLVDRYNTLLLERGRQLLRATPENPLVRNLDTQIANLRKDMQANLRSTRNRLRITRDDLLRKTGQLESEVRKVPATERTYLDLARQQQIKQELYVYLLQKREETAISKTANISNSRVIDPPKAAALPFSPRRSSTMFIGLLIGLSLPLAIIYLRDLLNTRIRSMEDIRRGTRAPVIGEIGHNTSRKVLIVNQESRSPIAEQFRAVRTNLAFYLKEKDQQTILLTSSMSGEGKSFASLNLAMVLALSGKKVLMMEMDLRKPNLSVKLGLSNGFGFTNFVITPSLAPWEIVKPAGIHEKLFLISSGPIPPNPVETIISERMEELMDYLKQQFEYIIIDAPPVGLVTDAQLLAKYADMTLYLVRQDHTYKKQLNIVEDLYSSRKMNGLTLLVNDVKAGGSYGHGNGYGYGSYGDEEIKRNRWKKLWKKEVAYT